MPTDSTNQADSGTDQDPGTQSQNTNQTAPQKFEDFLKSQPAEIQAAYQEHVAGLTNTVKETRRERDEFGKKLRDAAKGLEEGSKLKNQLDDLAGKLDQANARASFYEAAPAMECKNPKAAYAIMTSEDLMTKSGEPDWKALREAAPELFGKPTANANAGAGTLQQGNQANPHAQMNDFIRQRGQTQ